MQIFDVEMKAEVKGCAKSGVRLQQHGMTDFCSTQTLDYVIVFTITGISKLWSKHYLASKSFEVTPRCQTYIFEPQIS